MGDPKIFWAVQILSVHWPLPTADTTVYRVGEPSLQSLRTWRPWVSQHGSDRTLLSSIMHVPVRLMPRLQIVGLPAA